MPTKIYKTKTGKATLRKTSNFVGEFIIDIDCGKVFEYSPEHKAYLFAAGSLQHFVDRL